MTVKKKKKKKGTKIFPVSLTFIIVSLKKAQCKKFQVLELSGSLDPGFKKN